MTIKPQLLLSFLLAGLIFGNSHSQAWASVDDNDISNKYRIANTNLKRLNHLGKIVEPVGYPAWQINTPIILEMATEWLQGDFSALHFQLDDPATAAYVDRKKNSLIELTFKANDPHLKWQYQRTLTISPELFYRQPHSEQGSRRSGINLPFDSTYNLYIEYPDFQKNENKYHLLLSFKTPKISVFHNISEEDMQRPKTYAPKLNEAEEKNLQTSQEQHQKDSAQEHLRQFDGEGVLVALQDDGVRLNSVAGNRLSFRLQHIEDDLLGQHGGHHGTLMANFLIDYAPAITLLDFNVFPYVQHIDRRLHHGFSQRGLDTGDYAGLANHLSVDIMNVSLVSPVLRGRDKHWLPAIYEGLVISKSLGNNRGVKHRIDLKECTDPSNFMPYFAPYWNLDLSYGHGALVTLQAAIKTSQGYQSARSEAGNASNYTLTILETQTGATSQAAATFSGVFALIKQASEHYNRRYSGRQLVEILIETAEDIGPPGVDPVFGHGLVNVDRALLEIEKGHAPNYRLYSDLDSVPDSELSELYDQGCTTLLQ